MNNLRLYEQGRAVPKEAQKPISGGRLKGFTDINPMWRIKKLTEMFGPVGEGWYFKPLNGWTCSGADGVEIVNVEIELYYKLPNGEWSMPIYGAGGSQLISKEGSGLYSDDEAYKKATTDAIGSACKLLGIGADIYWSNDRTKYTERPEKLQDTLKNKEKKGQASAITELENGPMTDLEFQAIMELCTVKQFDYKKIEAGYGRKLKELTSSEAQATIRKLQGM